MKIRTVVILVVLLAAAAGTGHRFLWPVIRAAGAGAAVSEIPTTRVKRGAVAITITARGELQGGNSEMLVAPMVGSDSLNVTDIRENGEMVKAGDVVVEFDTTQQEYNLREAEADLAEARQKVIQTEAENQSADEEARYTVESSKTQVEVAKLELRRNAFVAAMKARDNEIALEAAQNKLKQAEQDLKNKTATATAGLAIQKAGEMKARTMADVARKNIENMTIRAKTSGYVNLQPNTSNLFFISTGMVIPPVQIGDTVRPGMNVAQIPDMEKWEVSAKIAEVDRGHLAQGQAVTVGVVALAGKSFHAKVLSMGNTVGQPWDRRFDCRMKLEESAPELRPGMTSNLVITAEKLENVLWAPSQALFEQDGRTLVYLQTPAGFTPKDVTLVKRSESQVVLTGLKEGDPVALSNPSEQKRAQKQNQSAMKAIGK